MAADVAYMDGQEIALVGKVLKFRVYSLWLRYSVRSVRKRGLLEQSMAFGQRVTPHGLVSVGGVPFRRALYDQDKLSTGLLMKAASIPETLAQQLVLEKSQDKANADHFPGPVEISQGKRVTETVSRGHQSKCTRATRAILQELDRLAAQTGTPEMLGSLHAQEMRKRKISVKIGRDEEKGEFESNNTCDEEKMNGGLQQNLQEAEKLCCVCSRHQAASSGLR